ncbi:MAG: hypothetical protein IKC59_07415, partial [Clostridia bacterium]|nr:hypothetical protein [Clostridia bacterium]
LFRKLQEMWAFLFNQENFLNYLEAVLDGAYHLSMFLMLAIPIVLLLFFVIRSRIMQIKISDRGKQSRGVKIFRRLIEDPTRAVISEIRCFVGFLWEQRWLFRYPFLLIWAINLNFATITFEFFSFYFYFAMAFDWGNLPVQLANLLIDLLVMFDGAPLPFWIVAGVVITDLICKHLGFSALERRERRNRAFLEKQPLVLMLTGTMGSKKTTTLTDMALSEEIRMREKALELLLECDALYPNFPWINLEMRLQAAFRCRNVYTLTSCREWVAMMRRHFERAPSSERLFGYDFDSYVLERDDGLWITNVWQTIEDYACLYLIYVVESSLIASNYAIRTDCELQSVGNFPIWSTSLFRRTSREAMERSSYSHILNYDTLRLGKKMLQYASPGSFEFGVISIAEVGKERGNTVTQQEIKKNVDSCNQKNDLFNWFLKICRHPSTVRNHPFIRILTDDQRPESWGADARDLASIIHIRESSSRICLKPLFFVCDLIYDLVYRPYDTFYVEYRFCRSDVNLFLYLAHNVMTAFHRYHQRTLNVFGVYELDFETERGTMDGEKLRSIYYVSTLKDYSWRFATDSHRGYIDKIGTSSKQGLNDWQTYADRTASVDELHQQRSHFVTEMEKLSSTEE